MKTFKIIIEKFNGKKYDTQAEYNTEFEYFDESLTREMENEIITLLLSEVANSLILSGMKISDLKTINFEEIKTSKILRVERR